MKNSNINSTTQASEATIESTLKELEKIMESMEPFGNMLSFTKQQLILLIIFILLFIYKKEVIKFLHI
jgi:hypothetical protein